MIIHRHFSLFITLIEREIRARYIGSLGGISWALVHPLVLLGLYTLLFRTIFQVRLPGNISFVEFVAVALWPWMAFQEGVQRGAQAVRAHASLVRKVAFPHELLVIAAVVATFVVHMLGFLFVLALLHLFGSGVEATGLPLALVGVAALLVLAIAAGLLLSAVEVFAPDVEQFLPLVFMALFYSTPILYPISIIPEWLRAILVWNPMYYLVGPIRTGILEGMILPNLATWTAWAVIPMLLVVCLNIFRRLSPHFEDFL